MEEVKRMRYYDGLSLKPEDYTTEQNYNIQMRRLMNWGLNKVSGILEGLQVQPVENTKKYRITKGIALSITGDNNWYGKEIVLPSDKDIDLSDKSPGVYYVTITYEEIKADIDNSKGSHEIHWIERPKISIVSLGGSIPPSNIILAKITVPEGEWKSESDYVSTNSRKEIGPALRSTNNNVGIGTSTQPAKLEVTGDIKATGIMEATGGFIGDGSQLTGVNQWTNVEDGISYNNKVGIGTTTPSTKLNVDPKGAGEILIGNPNWKEGGYTSLAMGISKEKEGYAWIRSIKSSGISPGDICLNPEYQTGNVGIGTASPSARLDVIGNIKGSNDLFIAGSVGIGTTNIKRQLHIEGSEIHSGGTGAGFSFASRSADSFVDSPGQGERWVWYSYGKPGSAFLWSGRNLLSIDKDGNVGIGTDKSIGKLDVRGDIHAGNSDLYFTKVDHDHSEFGNAAGYAAIENAANYDALMILGRAGTPKGRYVRLWDYLQVNGGMDVTDKVGIGTTNPQRLLHISSNDGQCLGLQSTRGGVGSTVGLDFLTDTTQNNLFSPTASLKAIGDERYSSHLVFITKDPGKDTNTLTERLRITSDGRVGIGTMSPSTDLDVANGGKLNEIAIGTAIYGDLDYPYESLQLKPEHNLRINFGSTETAMFSHDGDLRIKGKVITSGGDFAENYSSDMDLEIGDVVCLDEEKDGIVISEKSNDPLVLGVISTEPGFLLNAKRDVKETKMFPVALCGRVPCKVVDENGPIKRGDLLISSSTPGHAMKANPIEGEKLFCPGTIIGKSIGKLESGNGVIDIFVFPS